ncbi:MAG: AIR synthase-related protein [Planctomycetaceae bacterium]
MFLTTSGIGELSSAALPGVQGLQPDDVISVSGPLGAPGAAVLCAREHFNFDPPPQSDCAPLTEPIQAILNRGLIPRAMRDATRGGIAAVLHEWTGEIDISATLIEDQIPVSAPVRAVCELLGLDPVHLANEGTFLLATPASQAERTVQRLREFDVTRDAAVIGRFIPSRRTSVSLVRISGREVPLDEPMGAPLPRIC